MVSGSKGKCWFPNDAQGLNAALEQMTQRLPGFDKDALDQLTNASCGGVVTSDKAKHPARAAGA